MMGITKQKFGNEHEMSINEFSHYLLFPGLFVAFTYNKKQPPAFGAAPAFWCILLSFLGLSFRHIPNNLSNYNVLTANAAFFIKSQGHGLIMRVVFYHGVGSQVFMDSFFVTGVDPKAIMSQNAEAIEKLFFFPLSRTS